MPERERSVSLTAQPLTAAPSGPLSGDAAVPGDKSISHRALIMGALAIGDSEITGLLEGDDVRRTARALEAFGARIARDPDGATWRIRGVGIGGLREPADVLDLGNSGTGARLLMGLVASHPIQAVFTGDQSLRQRPMGRVTAPLEKIGAVAMTRQDGRMPVTIRGTSSPVPIAYASPVASAQVKSAVLLAGLNIRGRTTVIESIPTRDHTALMFRHFGVEVTTEPAPEAGDAALAVTVTGQPEITGRTVTVPADPSSAAFPIVAGLVVPGSSVRLANIGLNPLRTGFLDTLEEMGAHIVVENDRRAAGEPVGDLHVSFGELRGVDVPASQAARMIDEYPVLAVAAAYARGTTRFNGIGELRVKESDRIAAMMKGLVAAGVRAEAGEDWMEIHGTGQPPRGLAEGAPPIETRHDHRIAMAFLTLGLGAENAVTVDDGAMIETSFPGFQAVMRGLGAKIADGRKEP